MDKSGRSINAITLHISLLVLFGPGCVADSIFSNIPNSITLQAPAWLETPEGPSASIPRCITGTQSLEQELKILFMIDHSKSADDSDPSFKARIDPIQKFLAKYGSKQNLTYGLSYFNQQVETFDDSGSKFVSGSPLRLLGSSSELSQALSTFQLIPSDFFSNYVSAFTALRSLIAMDFAAGGQGKVCGDFYVGWAAFRSGYPVEWHAKSCSRSFTGLSKPDQH